MADLLHNKFLRSLSFNSPCSISLSFPLSRSPHPNFCISRFAPVKRSRLSRSSPVLANLSPDSTRLDIISTAKHSDGSVVFKFGDASENSQRFENVKGSDAQSEVLGDLDDEHGVNHAKSELVGTSGGEHEMKLERESVSDGERTEVAENDGTEVVNSTDSNEDENYSIEVEGSAQTKVDEDDCIEVENFTERKIEHQETVLESVTQEGELVGLSDSLTDLQSGDQSNGDSVEDEQNHNLISTVEIENSSDSEMAKHDSEANNLAAISDSIADLVMENSRDSELVKHDIGIETLVITSNSSVDLIMEKCEEKRFYSELVAAVSASQLELDGIELLEVPGNSSSVETLGRAVSLEDSEIGRNMKHAASNEDDDNDMLEVADTESPVETSDMIESLEDKELDSDVKHVANDEVVDNDLLETPETYSPIEASDIAVSLRDDENDSNVGQLVNEEHGNNDTLETAETNLPTEASDVALSLTDDEHDSNVKQVVNEEDDGNDMLKTAATNSTVEAPDIAVSSEDDEHNSDLGQLVNKKHGDNDTLQIAETKSPIEASDIAVSLADDEHDNGMKQIVNEEDYQNKFQQVAAMNSVIEASGIVVSVEEDELDSNVKQVANEEDSDGKLQKIADVDSPVEASDMAVSLGDSVLDSNEKHMLNEDDGWVEAEPILEEEASCDWQDDIAALESTSDPNMVDEAAPPIIPLSNDDLFGGDSLEEATSEASGLALAEANVDSVNSVESAASILYLSSAAASLPYPGEALTGGEDAYFVCQNWFGVSDGVGHWSFAGTDRGKYALELMRNCEKLALNSQDAGLADIKEVLLQIAVTTESSGSARVLIAHFANQALHVANIGDTGFVIIRNGLIFKKSSPMVHEFNFPYAVRCDIDLLEAVEEYHIELEDGDVIIAATDGLYDNLYEQEIASIVSKSVGAGMEPKELAEVLVTKAQEVGSLAYGRSPFADAAQAAGYTGVVGGKLDHVTVIVSLVKNR